jgi:hypothetical protein
MNTLSRAQLFLSQNGPFKLMLHVAAHPKYRWELFKARYLPSNKIRIEGDMVRVNQDGTNVNFKVQSDFQYTIGLIFENFLYEEYGNLDVKSKKVIDIGASIGDTALYFASKGADVVYGYEIDKGRQKEAAKNLAINPNLSKRIEYINEGVTPQKLNALISKIRRCSIKIDCDNPRLETELIVKLTDSNMKKTDQIIMEYSDGYKDIEKKLSAHNFDVKVKQNRYYNSGILFAAKKHRAP